MTGTIFSWLLSPSDLTPHGFCLLWQPGLIWTDASADFATGAAYFAIPTALTVIIRRRKDLLFRPILWLFTTLILFCGVTHWLDVLTLWVPVYVVQGAAKSMTAAVSVVTAIALCRVLPEALSRPSLAEFKALHEELRQGKDFLDRTGKVAGVGGWEVDLATNRVSWTSETYRIHGLPLDYQPTREASIGFYTPEAQPILRAAVEKAIAEGGSWDLELPFNRADGERIWVRAMGTVTLAHGQPIRLTGAVQDVTVHVAARQQLDAALSNMSEGLCFFDKSQRLVLSNRRFAEIYGLSVTDIPPGITLEEVVARRIAAGSGPSVTLPQYMDWAKDVIVCREETVDVAHLANGRVIARRVRLMPDGGWVATHADVTAARSAEAALRESEARFRLLAEHSGDVVLLSDVDGPRRYVSPAAERVLGWRPEDLVGRPAIEFVHPEDLPGILASQAAMRAGASEDTVCYRHRRPDNSWLWVEARVRKYANGEGRGQYVAVLRDATARKAAEQALLEALAHTERVAATDGLTGLANRRQFDHAADREWRRCAREALPLSVLLLDADRFKQFNDRYGHIAGDACLRAVAAQLDTAARRPGDVAARYGGEEFVMLMPDTDQTGAVHVAESLCKLVRDLQIPHADNDAEGIMTVSIGVATAIPWDRDSGFDGIESLLLAADAALYRAKNGGRNRVAVAARGTLAQPEDKASIVGRTTLRANIREPL